jgi:hypothetical protein
MPVDYYPNLERGGVDGDPRKAAGEANGGNDYGVFGGRSADGEDGGID